MTKVEYLLSLVNDGVQMQRADRRQTLKIDFQRTIRVPDNSEVSELPPGLGQFKLFKIKDYANKLPADMVAKGGLFLPMYQREAMWISLRSDLPFLIKIYCGGVNIISGEHHVEDRATKLRRNTLRAAGKSVQDYVVTPSQLWIDGIATSPGIVKQFVAMPFGSGYSVEAQVTGQETTGGLQFEITPRSIGSYISPSFVDYELPPKPDGEMMQIVVKTLTGKSIYVSCNKHWLFGHIKEEVRDKEGIPLDQQRLIFAGKQIDDYDTVENQSLQIGDTVHLVLRLRGGGPVSTLEQSIAAGGMIKQQINRDIYSPKDWHEEATATFNVQIINSKDFQSITGQAAPSTPIDAETYTAAGLPFFSMYEEKSTISGDFKTVKSIAEIEQREEKTIKPKLTYLDKLGSAIKKLSLSRTSSSTQSTTVNPEDEIPSTPESVKSEYVKSEDGILSNEGPLREFRTLSDLEKELDGVTLAEFN